MARLNHALAGQWSLLNHKSQPHHNPESATYLWHVQPRCPDRLPIPLALSNTHQATHTSTTGMEAAEAPPSRPMRRRQRARVWTAAAATLLLLHASTGAAFLLQPTAPLQVCARHMSILVQSRSIAPNHTPYVSASSPSYKHRPTAPSSGRHATAAHHHHYNNHHHHGRRQHQRCGWEPRQQQGRRCWGPPSPCGPTPSRIGSRRWGELSASYRHRHILASMARASF